ncbi:MAG: MFS transporter [Anaerolineales bacterium]
MNDKNPMRRVLSIRDFFLLWIGQSTSLLGDQFNSIAGAWLVLKMTGDPLALGTVMALGGIPRAIFTVIGGAITDRVSPRKVMLMADLIRLGISALLAAQVLTGTLEVWMIYVYSLVSGIVSGVFAPASMSIAPFILPGIDLQAGNSLMQGSMQLIGFVGPALAGGLIAIFPDETIGVGLAIAIDALTFLVSVVTLWMMKAGGQVISARLPGEKANVWRSIGEGIAYMFKDPALRLMFILVAIANLAFGGPVIVGIPFLADTRFPEGAAAYGLIVSGYAGGNLLGIVLSGVLPKPSQSRLKILLVVMFGLFGLGIGALAWIDITLLAMADLFLLGVLNGYLSIILITGLQRNTPKEMLGRLMSMVLLANMGLMPLSQAMAGVILRWNVPMLFIGAAGLLLICTFYLSVPKVGNLLSTQLVNGQAEA